VLHELSHLKHSEQSHGASLHADPELLSNAPCLTCEAFAQVLSPATSQAATPNVLPAAVLPIVDPGYGILTADSPTPRSRGPPQV
jgi:hypothetical protein